MKEIKKINALSLANIMAGIYAAIGFFMALSVAISTMANIITQKDFSGSIVIVTLFNVGTGILLGLVVALIIGFLGWIFGYVIGLLYNMFAKRLGGFKIELREVEDRRKINNDNL